MSPAASPEPDPPAAPRAGFWASLGWPGIVIALGLGVAVAVVLDPIFIVPFRVLLGRTLLLAAVLLLVHAAARRWVPRGLPAWLPVWAWPMIAITVAAPTTTVLIYLASVQGDMEALVRPARIMGILFIAGCGVAIGLAVAGAAAVRTRLAEARAQELQFALERSRLEKQAVDARLALLQAQIEPHFLFNTLANVQALVEAGSPRAAEVLKSLIAYLRAAVPRLHQGGTLGQELALVRAYLELMRMRMPDRLDFVVRAEPALEPQPFPAMGLLTLVENAVRHGIDPLEQGGRIEVCAEGDARRWSVSVADTGAGLDPMAAPGTGLSNLRERLQAAFGTRAALQLEEAAPHGLRARIVIEGEGA